MRYRLLLSQRLDALVVLGHISSPSDFPEFAIELYVLTRFSVSKANLYSNHAPSPEQRKIILEVDKYITEGGLEDSS